MFGGLSITQAVREKTQSVKKAFFDIFVVKKQLSKRLKRAYHRAEPKIRSFLVSLAGNCCDLFMPTKIGMFQKNGRLRKFSRIGLFLQYYNFLISVPL